MIELFSVGGLIAVMVVGAAVFGYIYSIAAGRPIEDIPNWLSMAVGSVIGFFYGKREVEQKVAQAKAEGDAKVAAVIEATKKPDEVG